MAKKVDLSGIWHSICHYKSTTRPGDRRSEHDMKIYQVGNQLVMQSLSHPENSYMLIRVTRDDRILTGSWHEETLPGGIHKGVNYYGAVQLIISDDGKSMQGKYVGFNRQMEVLTGEWEINKTDKTE